MKKGLHLTICLLIFYLNYGQICTYTNLSKDFDFKVTLKRMKKDGEGTRECDVKVEIIKKITKAKQVLTFHSEWMFKADFADSKTVRSYSTKYNLKAKAVDNDFGDLVIADLNFDGREDIAIKKDSGGNGGPLYNFYLQDKTGTFIIDSFLTGSVEFFPSKIDYKEKTLITLVHANAYELSETTFKLKDGKWEKITHRFVSY